jgi:tetratricopeptide (TPR) repeat protein
MFQQFHPDFVLEGSFRIRNEVIETRIRLIDAAADTVLLTDKLKMRMEPDYLYEAQDEMVARIAARIAVEYGPIGHHARRASRAHPSIKWDTYAWISRYFEHGFQLDYMDRREIEDGLKHSVTVDPTSAEAHAALSMIHIEQYRVMSADCGDPKRLEVAKTHALLAVRHDPQCALAHQALALAYFHEKRFVDFRASVKRALHLNPGHSHMLAMFGLCFVRRGEWDEALPLLNRAIELNPLHPSWYHMPTAMLLMMTKGADEAITEITRNPMPDFFAFHFVLLWFQVEKGDMVAAEVEKGRLLAIAPDLESFTRRYFDTIWLCEEIADRAIAALLKVGLHIDD